MALDVFGVRLDYLTVTYYSSHSVAFLPGLFAQRICLGMMPVKDLFGMQGLCQYTVPEGEGTLGLYLQNDGSGRVHVRASGHVSELAFKVLGDLEGVSFQSGLVTRYDVAVDGTLGEESYRQLCDGLVTIAGSRDYEGRPMTTTVAGDWYAAERGRTLYVGAPSSAVRVRFYEKGIQLGSSPNWVRFEWQVRPVNVYVRDITTNPPGSRYAAMLEFLTGWAVLPESLRVSSKDPVAGGLPWLERMSVAMLRKVDSDTREQFFLRLASTRW